ncbi:MAG: hypothetical protein J6D29_05425 [Solobacterium sp.]|nr:hypothetical protein [Solobacterium sp.]
MKRAKELFIQYSGNRFYMDLNGDRKEYDSYAIPKEIEEEWRKEYLSQFFAQKKYGKDALISYGHAIGFLKRDMRDDYWERLLYYPLRSDWLDDVTVLFMLPISFQLAEQWANKGKFSRDAALRYMRASDDHVQNIMKRVNTGMLTRADDYSPQDFRDEAYIASYLKDLQQKWTELSQKLKK